MDSCYVMGGLAGALGIFAFFAGIALCVWVGGKAEVEKRKLEAEKLQMDHAERMKALEVGLPLPPGGQPSGDAFRACVAGFVGLAVPLGLATAASLTTWNILDYTQAYTESSQRFSNEMVTAVLCTIWGTSGLVSLITVVASLATVAQSRSAPPAPSPSPAVRDVIPVKD
jgi:hypothetical protein